MKTRIRLTLVLIVTIFAGGCAAQKSYLASADFPDRAGELKRVGVLVAEARIINLHGGGGSDLNLAESERCATCTESSAKESLTERGYAVVAIPVDDDTRALLADYLKTRGVIGSPFPSNRGHIEGLTPLPSAPEVCEKNGVDGIVFVAALDHVSTGSRKALMIARAALGITGGEGIAYADIAVIDRTGKFIFYDWKAGSTYTLTEDEDVHQMFSELVASLPQAPAN